jgi:acyl carrier protein
MSDTATGLWLTERLGGAGRTYHMPLPIRFLGGIDRERLSAAVDAVVSRHPALSTRFIEEDGRPVGRPGRSPSLSTDGDPDAPFDLEAGPLARFHLDGDTLYTVAHHLIFDGVSKDVLVRDLALAYAGRLPDGIAEPAPATAGVDATSFWASRPAPADGVHLPGGYAPAPARPEPGATLAIDLSSMLDKAADRVCVSRFEAILTALHAVLRSHGNDAPIGVDLSTRPPGEADAIGVHVNELPVPAPPAPTLAALAQGVRAEMRAMNAVRTVSYAHAVGGMRPRAAIAPVCLSYRKRGPEPRFDGHPAAVEWAAFTGWVRAVLQLQIVDGADRVEAHLRFNKRLVSADVAALIGRELVDTLAAMADESDLLLVTAPAAIATPIDGRPTAEPDALDAHLVQVVSAAWCDALGIAEVGPSDDLYDLGGHSLVITQISARLRKELGVEIPFDVFLDNPTVAGVVAAIEATA